MGYFGSTNHLVKRFLYSLRRFGKSDEGQLTLFALLNEKERQLFDHQSEIDQKHSLRSVMRLVEIEGPDAHPDLVVAAALHDVGKTQSQLGVLGRVVATCVSAICGLGRVHNWGHKARGTMLHRISVYVTHPEIGARMLEEAGSSKLTVTWARDHHKTLEESSLEKTLFATLAKADRA
tara:strand:+ start:43 stop:576 length:534 start_codon:yes stop_codon:yes gene_type:complete